MNHDPPTGSDGSAPRGGSAHDFSVADHELIARIGQGSYGEVWLARNIFGIFRAVKVLYRRNFRDDRPFRREYEGIRRFEPISRSHEGFVDILQIGQDLERGYFYYVMELGDDARMAAGEDSAGYVPRTLATELRDGAVPMEECIRIGISLSSALHQLHSQGLVHRDIKPSNIIFVGGAPKLADIGLVAELNDARSYVGTEGFIPPEGPGTPQADVYGLGKVLYEISTGRDRMDFPALPADLHQNPEAARLLELDEIFRRACEKDLKQRYATAWALHSDLVLLNHGGSVKRLRTLERRWVRAKRVGTLSALILLVCGILAVPVYREWQAALQERERQVATQIAQGVQLMEQGDMAAALAAYVGALSMDVETPARQVTHRLRIGSVLGQSPSILGSWTVGEELNEAWFAKDEQVILAVGEIAGVHQLGADGAATQPLTLGLKPSRLAMATEQGWLATAHQNRAAAIWSPDYSTLLFELPHPAHVNSVHFSSDGLLLVTGCDDGQVRIWTSHDGRLEHGWLAHNQVVTHVRFSPDGRHVATASWDGTAKLWELDGGRLAAGPMTHASWVGYLAFSPDGERLVTAGFDHVARVWESRSGRKMLPDLEHVDAVQSAEFSPDGKLIVTASLDGVARIWDAETGRPIPRNPVLRHRTRLKHATFSADGQRVLTAALDGGITLWDLGINRGHRLEECRDRYYSESGQFYGVLTNSQLHFQDGRSGGRRSQMPDVGAALARQRLDRHGRLLFVQRADSVGTEPGMVEAIAVDSGRSLGVWPWSEPLRSYPGMGSLDGKWYALTEGNNAVLHEVLSGARMELMHPTPVHLVRFSVDGRWLATAAGDEMRLWEVGTGREMFGMIKFSGRVSSIEFSSNGRHLAVASQDDRLTRHSARLFDPRSGQETTRPLPHDDGIHTVQFSPDSRRLATGGEDFNARVWDSITGEPLTPALRHRNQVFAAVFSPNGYWLATGAADMRVRIWDAKTGDPLAPSLLLPEAPMSLAFLDDHPRILIRGHRGTYWIWDLGAVDRALEDVAELAKALTGAAPSR